MPPVVSLNGGPSVTTDDPTPTIAGPPSAAAGTIVHVTVGSLALTALVQPEATWNVRTAPLTDGTRTVTATVADPAGNKGTATQQLIIDTHPPALTITGGANRLTHHRSP